MPKTKKSKRTTKAFGDYRIRDLAVSDEELVELVKDNVLDMLKECREHIRKMGGKIIEDSLKIIVKKRPGNGDPITRFVNDGTIGISFEAKVPVDSCVPENGDE